MEHRITGTAVIDEAPPLLAPEPVAPRRRRGRPVGAKAKIAQHGSGSRITASQTAFLRACVQGVDAKAAAKRYLLDLDGMDRRESMAYVQQLRDRLHMALQASPHRATGEDMLARLDESEPPVPAAQAAPLPTLEEFAAGFPEDMYGEEDLIALYQDQYRTQEPEAAPKVSPKDWLLLRLEAVQWFHDNIAQKIRPTDPVGLWISTGIADKLREHGVLTLEDAVHWINLRGAHWYAAMEGIGRTRARRIVQWLVDNQDDIQVEVSWRIREGLETPLAPREQFEGRSATVSGGDRLLPVSLAGDPVEMFGIVPIDELAWPRELLGDRGVFRSGRVNTLDAHNDREAVHKWFLGLNEKSSATQEIYRRAIERLVLWAIVERRKALSSLTTEDFRDFKAFLRAPPAHWCQKLPLMKSSKDWRPLRGPLKDQSIQQTMSAIATMYRDWHQSGYIESNAVASVRGTRRKEMHVDVMRSFSHQALQAIRTTLLELPDGPRRRRLRAIILLLQTGGLRRGEATRVTWGQIERVRLDNMESDIWALRFKGKGGRERTVPLKPETLDALEIHYQDRLQLIQSLELSAYAGLSKEETPLLSILDERLAMGSKGRNGDMPSSARREKNETGALSDARLHGILKVFFKAVERRCGDSSADFKKASAHWLRHTFAHQSLQASGKDLAVVQQLLGHADISTTGIYIKADMSSRVSAVLGVEAAV